MEVLIFALMVYVIGYLAAQKMCEAFAWAYRTIRDIIKMNL